MIEEEVNILVVIRSTKPDDDSLVRMYYGASSVDEPNFI